MATVEDLQPAPELVEFGECWACGAKVAWIHDRFGRPRAVDVRPHPWGEWALLRDGRSAVNLTSEPACGRIASSYAGPRFVDHNRKTCAVPSLRTMKNLAHRYERGALRELPLRESIREQLLRIDRARDSRGDSD